jgi:hypothetical protein
MTARTEQLAAFLAKYYIQQCKYTVLTLLIIAKVLLNIFSNKLPFCFNTTPVNKG